MNDDVLAAARRRWEAAALKSSETLRRATRDVEHARTQARTNSAAATEDGLRLAWEMARRAPNPAAAPAYTDPESELMKLGSEEDAAERHRLDLLAAKRKRAEQLTAESAEGQSFLVESFDTSSIRPPRREDRSEQVDPTLPRSMRRRAGVSDW
ncbi:hypothetical protein EV193_106355 [Herbihabitans rhizosphaerae]|uniref:Uncharacterized protein n=1 Tax=Herbihabitans rhizosphaerae TaxID=1872711 RepID=A0A4Q7KLI7_9PSEU|nr:hypothetical protein [Herbihabitans rhizosphaerae]RZS37117.1 hypothetical protein EV193_106355 [Herbihabitans rhizosphaerae]